MIILGLVAITVAMLLVRLGWSGRRGVAPVGWALGVGGLLLLAASDGAWGLAVGTVTGMAVAIAIVLHAGWRSPVKVRRPARTAPSITLPHRPAELARRLFVFVLVVPIGFVAAQWLAFGTQALARRGGSGEADALALTLFLQPLLWSFLMAWQMTRATPMRMIAPPASAAVLGTILWSLS
jgi:hypothetical protein